MVIELVFKNRSRRVRRVQILIEQFTLTELVENNAKALTKLIEDEREPNEVLTEIRDLEI
jgi:hypothetical protein